MYRRTDRKTEKSNRNIVDSIHTYLILYLTEKHELEHCTCIWIKRKAL